MLRITILIVPSELTPHVLTDVGLERVRQEEIGEGWRAKGTDWRSCADPAIDGGNFARATVLGEEYGEVCRAALEAQYAPTIGSAIEWRGRLRTELVQVAAVAVAWVEAIDAEIAAGVGS